MSILDRLRDRNLNPLIWPFFISTLAYGIGAVLSTSGTAGSSLVAALIALHPLAHYVWGTVAIFVVIGVVAGIGTGATRFNQTLTLTGFLLWVFGIWCYSFVGGWIPLFSVAVPNTIFWIYMYLRVSINNRLDSRIDPGL